MKVTLNDMWVLGDDHANTFEGPRPISGFSGNAEFDEQINHFTRASQVQHQDRGNVRTTFTFNMSRETRSPGEAEQELLQTVVDLTHNRFGLVTLENFGVGAHQAWYLPEATVKITSFAKRGATWFMSFRISGGLLSQDRPEEEEGNDVPL